MRVDIEEIKDIMERRKRINSVPLEEIEFYENGEKLNIDPALVEEFNFIGLNNIDFITSGFYLEDPKDRDLDWWKKEKKC